MRRFTGTFGPCPTTSATPHRTGRSGRGDAAHGPLLPRERAAAGRRAVRAWRQVRRRSSRSPAARSGDSSATTCRSPRSGDGSGGLDDDEVRGLCRSRRRPWPHRRLRARLHPSVLRRLDRRPGGPAFFALRRAHPRRPEACASAPSASPNRPATPSARDQSGRNAPVGTDRARPRRRTPRPAAIQPDPEQAGRPSRDDRPRAPRGGLTMTADIEHRHRSARIAATSARPPSERFVLGRASSRPARPASDAGRRSTSRSSSIVPARCPAPRSTSRSAPSRRRSPDSSLRTGSASSSTTTWSMSSSNRRRHPPRPAAGPWIGCGPIDARGSTNLSDGWLRGCEQVAAHLSGDGVEPMPAPDRRPRQQGHHRSGRARRPRGRAPGTGRVDDARSGSATTSTSASSRSSPTPAAAISTTSPTPRRSATPSRRRWARPSRSWPATWPWRCVARDDLRIEPISPNTVTSRGGRTVVAIGDLGSEQVVEVVLRLSFPYGDLGRRPAPS